MAIDLQIVLNKDKGSFTGGFDLTEAINNYYDDYVDINNVITNLSILADPVRGALATVRIIGGSLASDAIPTNWAFSGDTISQDIAFYNEIMILYVSSTDIRIVNRLVDAPDITAPIFSVAPTATNIAETSFDITATLNEDGTVYGYLLANGSPAPTAQEIIDNAQSQFTDSGSGGTLSFTGLVVDTNYDVYVVAEDTAGNKQASPVLVEVLTQSQFDPSLYNSIILNKGVTVYDASLIDLQSANVRDNGTNKFLINWIDQSPNENNAIQATEGNQFIIEEPSKSLIPDALNDFMLSSSVIFFNGTIGFSAYFALNKNNSDDLQIIMGRGTSGSYNIFTIKNGSTYEFRINSTTDSLVFPISTNPQDILGNKIFEIHHNGTGSAEILINGVSFGNVLANNVSKDYNRIGSRASANYVTGKINAIQSYQLLTAQERIDVREALAFKFDITL